MKRFFNKSIYIFGFLVVLILLLLILKVPYKIQGPCRLLPQHEWFITQIEPDKFSVKLVLNDSNKVRNITLLQFDRQDFVKFSLASGISSGKKIKRNELVGRLESSDNLLQIANLTGELNKAQANLKFLNSGEKYSIQQEAIQNLEYAKKELHLFEPQIERSRKLLEQNLISRQEWEIVDAQYKLLNLKVFVEESRAEITKTGDKTEALEVAEAEVLKLEKQIAVFQEKLGFETIRSPIDGIVTDPVQPNTLCQITKMDTMIAQIPVPSRQIKYLKIGQQANIRNFENNIFLTGKINAIGNNARLINNNPMYIVTCVVENKSNLLLPGMTGFIKIYCEKISIWQRLTKTLKIYFATRFIR